MLEIKGLSYAYPGDETENVLKNISVSFLREHILAILGKSGSGKTTLLKCIGKFLTPRSGSITLDGKDIFDIDQREFRKAIGIVFQQLYLFPHLTVLENMTLAPLKVLGKGEREAEKEARETLNRLGIEELADQYPSQISGGQAQRTAIARSLILKPEYLLLDEPTSALDVDTTNDFGKWLLDLKAETTFIIVTHDILFASKIVSSGILLSRGEIQEKGSMQDILEKAGYAE